MTPGLFLFMQGGDSSGLKQTNKKGYEKMSVLLTSLFSLPLKSRVYLMKLQ